MKGPPAERRRTIDLLAGQIGRSYFRHLNNYQKALFQRNNLLKNNSFFGDQLEDTLSVWEQQLAEYGSLIIYQRLLTLRKIMPLLKTYHQRVSGSDEQLQVKYISSLDLNEIGKQEKTIGVIKERFLSALKSGRSEDIRRRATLKGPHRDDFCFMLDGKDMRRFGSQGQQRTMILALKIAEAELICRETDEYPVLLLDDVFSELDDNRRDYLLESIDNKIQTFITAAHLSDEKQILGTNGKKFVVRQGTIS